MKDIAILSYTSSLPDRQLRKMFKDWRGYINMFTAGQAAQKYGVLVLVCAEQFTAGQAAQKYNQTDIDKGTQFTAGQAAQKV